MSRLAPRTDPPRTIIAEYAAAAALFVIISLLAARSQQVGKIFGDAEPYHDAARFVAEGQVPVAGEAPFVYRPATPWFAAAINPAIKQLTPPWFDALVDHWTGRDDVPPFYAINIAASFAVAMLLLAYLRLFVPSRWIRLLLVAAWMAQWHAPTRFVYFYPVNVEPLFLACLVAALLVIERTRGESPWRAMPLLVTLVFAGTLCRESMLLAPVMFIAAHRPLALWRARPSMVAVLALPLLAWVVATLVTRLIAVPSNDYQWWTEPLAMIRTKPVFTWLLAWFFAFGPATIAIIAIGWTRVRQFLSTRPHLVVGLAATGALAYAGGTDTERILGWCAPIVYVLAGVAIEQERRLLARLPLLCAVLAVTQAVSSRIFWPIPAGVEDQQPAGSLGFNAASLWSLLDKLWSTDNYYANLWSYYGSVPIHAALLAFDVVFVVIVTVYVRRSASSPAHAPRPAS